MCPGIGQNYYIRLNEAAEQVEKPFVRVQLPFLLLLKSEVERNLFGIDRSVHYFLKNV
jgi:hypothetical protein